MKPAKNNTANPNNSGTKKLVSVEGQWRTHRLLKATDNEAPAPVWRVSTPLTDREKVELLRAKLQMHGTGDATTAPNSRATTQAIHREDPQAGYDKTNPGTALNGTVVPNPKDARNQLA